MYNMKKLMTKVAAGLAVLTVIAGSNSRTAEAAVDNGRICPIESNQWQAWPQAADFASGTAIVMELGTGTVLLDKGMNDIRFPASITKVMTALIAMENSSLDTPVTFTETGLADAYAGSSNINPQLGETFTMEQCLYMILIKSANDVSTQVAEVVGGSVENFVNMMNQKAADLGCTNTHFTNANGLENDNHYTTAHDMALIGREAFKNELFRTIISTPRYVVGPTNKIDGSRVFETHVDMLPEGKHFYMGCLGGKTGYTDISQSTLITFNRRNDMDLIAVVMYAPGSDVAATDSIQILDYAYSNFRMQDGKVVTTLEGYPIADNAVVTPEPSKDSADEAKKETTPVKTAENVFGKTISNDDGTTSFKPSAVGIGAYIAIGILGALVIIGLFLIVISSIIRANRRKKRRMRRAQQRQNEKSE